VQLSGEFIVTTEGFQDVKSVSTAVDFTFDKNIIPQIKISTEERCYLEMHRVDKYKYMQY